MNGSRLGKIRALALRIAALAAAFLLISSTLGSGVSAAEGDGLVDLSRFSRLATEDSTLVEISLSGTLLDLAAGSLAGQERDIAKSIAGLDAVNVVVVSLEGEAYKVASDDLDAMQKELARAGWQSIARVRDASSSVNVMLLERDGRVHGLTVGALDRGEGQLVLVNIAGTFDPDHLAGLLQRFGAEIELPDLGAR